MLSALLLNLQVRPFVHPSANRLEITSLLALLISGYAGLFFLSAREPTSSYFLPGKDCNILLTLVNLAKANRWLLFLAVLSANIIFFLYAAKLISQFVLLRFLRKCPRLTLFCCKYRRPISAPRNPVSELEAKINAI